MSIGKVLFVRDIIKAMRMTRISVECRKDVIMFVNAIVQVCFMAMHSIIRMKKRTMTICANMFPSPFNSM